MREFFFGLLIFFVGIAIGLVIGFVAGLIKASR
jgi:hypothetical protein